jgi:hypothetical protein
MTLGCRAFFLEFLSEFEKEREQTNWEKIYHKNRIWTAKMLGTGRSRGRGDYGVLGHIGQKFGYVVQAEWMRIDQIWYVNLPLPENWEQQPWKTDVAIEPENDITRLEFTIFKFGEVSVPLKVGLFYPGDDEEDALNKCREMILRQVSSYPGGVYLIIFGFFDEENAIYWLGYEIDTKGNTIKLNE